MGDVKLGKMLEQPKSPDHYLVKASGIGQSAGDGPTPFEIGWLAGLWDGEGSITVFHHDKHFRPVVCVTNTNLVILQKAVEIMDAMGIRMRVQQMKISNGVHADAWQVTTTKLSIIERFLDVLTPHLVGKKPQALLMSRFIRNRSKGYADNEKPHRRYDAECAEIEQEMRSLNKKGPKPQRLDARLLLRSAVDIQRNDDKVHA